MKTNIWFYMRHGPSRLLLTQKGVDLMDFPQPKFPAEIPADFPG